MQTPALRAQRAPSLVRPGFAVGASLALMLLAAACDHKQFEPLPTLPAVKSISPGGGASGVHLDAVVTATFTMAMDPSTINATTVTLKNGLIVVPTAVSYSGTTATLTPTSLLAENTLFTVVVTPGVRNAEGEFMARARTWNFTTGSVSSVLSTTPLNAAINVSRSGSIRATFSATMDPLSITVTTFTLHNGLVAVPAVVSYSGTTATLDPTGTLAPNTLYTATLSTGIKNADGIALGAAHNWTFTTIATSPNGPAVVNLGTAGNFVILAKSGVSTTGTTAVVGDVGLSPAAATYLTGFAIIAPPTTSASSAQVTGLLFAADYDPPTPTMLTTAVLDMQAAYTDAAGRVLPDFTELGAGNIQGMNLVPGLYKWGTSVTIPSAVTLTGGINDVWIFQVAGNLVVSNGAIVTLAGGAQAKNVFWQVAGQATLGTTANFKGIILSQTLISMNTGTIMLGRALAQTAVTLNATQITKP